MTKKPTTVGDIFDQRGPCALMALVMELAEAHRRIPVGHWIIELEPGVVLTVNGTKTQIESLPPWHSLVSMRGWPMVIFDVVEGTAVGQDAENEAIAALQRAIQAKTGKPSRTSLV